MKKLNLQFLFACCALVISGNIMATTQTYTSTPPGLTLISELGNTSSTPDPSLYPNPATYPFPVSINYPTGLWSNNVTSAKLRVYLADDLSTNFQPNFDAPMEFAIIGDIKDGASSTPTTEVEVFPNPFIGPGSAIATAAGLEEPNMLPSASSQYYEIDVTSMLNSSNTGTLSFSLNITGHYPDIYKDIPANNPLWLAITAAAQSIDSTYKPENPYHVWEDYVYEKAELIVTYNSSTPGAVNVPTLSEWSMIILMLCLAGFAAMRLKYHSPG